MMPTYKSANHSISHSGLIFTDVKITTICHKKQIIEIHQGINAINPENEHNRATKVYVKTEKDDIVTL